MDFIKLVLAVFSAIFCIWFLLFILSLNPVMAGIGIIIGTCWQLTKKK